MNNIKILYFYKFSYQNCFLTKYRTLMSYGSRSLAVDVETAIVICSLGAIHQQLQVIERLHSNWGFRLFVFLKNYAVSHIAPSSV